MTFIEIYILDVSVVVDDCGHKLPHCLDVYKYVIVAQPVDDIYFWINIS